jgi:hypothetical protein
LQLKSIVGRARRRSGRRTSACRTRPSAGVVKVIVGQPAKGCSN